MPAGTSDGYTGPYPTVSPTPATQGVIETSAGSTTAPPSVNTEGHSELESSSPGGSTETSAGATEAGPTVATEGHSELQTPAPGGSPETSAGYGGAQPTVPATPQEKSLPEEEGGGTGGQTSGGRTGALPNVAAAETHSETQGPAPVSAPDPEVK